MIANLIRFGHIMLINRLCLADGPVMAGCILLVGHQSFLPFLFDGEIFMRLTEQEKLWLLTAHPDTLELADEAPDWLKRDCITKGLARSGSAAGLWRLTERGYGERRALLD